MTISILTEEEFHNAVPQGIPFGSTEHSWYKTSHKNLYACINMDQTDQDWTYIIFGKDDGNEYTPLEIQHSFSEFGQAEKALYLQLLKLDDHETSIENIYESDLIEIPKFELITIDDSIKTFFQKHPEKLFDLEPRKFEELVASIIKDLGCDVELTQSTRDGGRDIIAMVRHGLTTYLTYIECKRYAPDNKVSVEIVRSVAGVHHSDRVNKSIIITTSTFTQDAIKFARNFEHQIDLKDYTDLTEMLSKYK